MLRHLSGAVVVCSTAAGVGKRPAAGGLEDSRFHWVLLALRASQSGSKQKKHSSCSSRNGGFAEAGTRPPDAGHWTG